MSARRAYAGPVEALTMEEAASRLRIGLDLFRKRYTGPLQQFQPLICKVQRNGFGTPAPSAKAVACG